MRYKHNAADIIEKGMELFRKNGYHNVGINQILKACNIPKGSFYNFFESKEDFVAQVIAVYGAISLERIKEKLKDKSISPIKRLRSFYSMLIDANEQDEFSGGCLVSNLSNEVGFLNQAIGTAADEEFMIWVKTIAKCVAEGQEKGEITTKFSALEIAEYLHAGLFGTFPRMKVSRSRAYMDSWFEMSFTFIATT